MYQLRFEPSTAAASPPVERVRAWIAERGGSAALADEGPGRDGPVLYVTGLPGEDPAAQLSALPGVARVDAVDAPAAAAASPAPVTVRAGAAVFGGGRASFVAGPCAVEGHDALLALARRLAGSGATALRGGAYKPRTSPYAFQGLGRPGLEILGAVARATGLAAVTEVLDPRDLEAVAGHADVLQIGSRNMANGALLKEAGRAGKPVLLKRGMSATLDEFLYAAEYLALGGCAEILLCERGLRHFDPAVRNLLDLSAVPALRARTGLPVLVDPSHGTGRAALVPAMLCAAAAAGADGFLVEVHERPDESWSDPRQALDPAAFDAAVTRTEEVLRACDRRLARPPVLRTTT